MAERVDMAVSDLNGAVNIDFLIKERDEYKREALVANEELLQAKATLDSVLKQKEYRNPDEIVRVRNSTIFTTFHEPRCK